jgi:hypothetical protein
MKTVSIGAIFLAMCMCACSSVHRYTPSEARGSQRTTFSSVVVPSTISGVVLEVLRNADIGTPADSGGVPLRPGAKTDTLARLERVIIQLDSVGGTLIRDSSLLVGRSREGESVSLPFDSVISLQYRGVDQGLTLMSIRQVLAAQDSVLAHPDRKVPRGKYGNWNVIDFDRSHATLDTVSGMLTGTSRGGIPVTVNLSEILHLTYSESGFHQFVRHPAPTMRVFVAMVIIGVAAFGPANHLF